MEVTTHEQLAKSQFNTESHAKRNAGITDWRLTKTEPVHERREY